MLGEPVWKSMTKTLPSPPMASAMTSARELAHVDLLRHEVEDLALDRDRLLDRRDRDARVDDLVDERRRLGREHRVDDHAVGSRRCGGLDDLVLQHRGRSRRAPGGRSVAPVSAAAVRAPHSWRCVERVVLDAADERDGLAGPVDRGVLGDDRQRRARRRAAPPPSPRRSACLLVHRTSSSMLGACVRCPGRVVAVRRLALG